MCGIAGWYLQAGKQRDLAQLRSMSSAIAHRGPDDSGEFVDAAAGVALAHRRLSIIDLSAAGHQPMTSADGRVVLIFNGELYNFVELRRELEGAGEVFRSRSDTEVVASALARWGSKALERFNGMFALAAWFPTETRLLLARDPMGMKPLYYTARGIGAGIAFASEVKAFLSMPDFGAELNQQSLRQYIEFGYVFDDHATTLAGVQKVPPGHMVEVFGGIARSPQAYFEPCFNDAIGRAAIADRAANLLHDRLLQVVSQHLVADVPVGLLLSGGLDSSVIAAIASRQTRVATITMGFAESRVDEREEARDVAKYIGSDHTEILIDRHAIVDSLEEVVWFFDDLFADWGTVSTRLLYRKCREQGIKVVLVGEGADELFGGYSIFRAVRAGRGPLFWRLFQLYRRYAGRRYGEEFGHYSRIMREHLKRANGSLFDAVRLFESRNQLPNNYVMKVDKASMSVSVEARAPFLDRRIAEFAYSVTEGDLLTPNGDKLVLRKMAKLYQLLPDYVSERPKFGASIAASWMDESKEFQRYASAVVLAPDGWVDQLGLRSAMTDFFMGKRSGYRFPHAISIFRNVAWRLLLLNLWSRRYLGTTAGS